MYTGVTEEQRTWTAERSGGNWSHPASRAISAVALAAALSGSREAGCLQVASLMSLARQHEEEAVWRWFED
jgi:hypothetical protein